MTRVQLADQQDGISIVITLENNPNGLPKIIDAWEGPFSGGIGRPIRKVTLEVQHWAFPDSISGFVHGDASTGGRLTAFFWVDRIEEKDNME